MTREEAKEFAPILQAYAEGKVIECRTDPSVLKKKDTPNDWTEMKEIEFWNNAEYRIKPKSTHRPFKDSQECWDEMLKHQPFGWVKMNDCEDMEHISHISSRNPCTVHFTREGAGEFAGQTVCSGCSLRIMFYSYSFADGTPFGIKEEK